MQRKGWALVKRVGAVIGAALVLYVPFALSLSPQEHDERVLQWYERLAHVVTSLHLHLLLLVVGSAAITWWLATSGDAQRVARILKRWSDNLNREAPEPVTADQDRAAEVDDPGQWTPPAATQTIIAPPPEQPRPLPEHEKTLRLKALDELYQRVVPDAKSAIANTLALLNNRRSVLLDAPDGGEQFLASMFRLREAYMDVKRSVAHLTKKHELHVETFPAEVRHFGDAQRLFDGTAKFERAINYVRQFNPVTIAVVELLEPWAYAYDKDVQQFNAWIDQCSAAIKAARKAVLDA